MFAVRASEFAHEVRYGGRGALIASLEISTEQFAGLESADAGRWVSGSRSLVRSVMTSAFRQECNVSLEDATWDVLAGPRSRMDAAPPGWLLSARDRMIEEDASIADLAAATGVHRVYFSRAFARTFGEPPTVYRRRLRALRAAAAAIDGDSPASSAYECGFADQSHMARELRDITGASYKRLRVLGAEVTSVQD